MSKNNGGWSPYLAGALTGLLGVLSVWIADKYYGVTTSFVRTAGMIGEIFGPERVAQMEYFIRNVPRIDWQWMFVAGILLGAMVSALTSGSFKWQAVPDTWSRRFGNNPLKRGVAAFAGGVIAMFGARLAGGCPSGHGLGGLPQLSVSGFVALACFFIGGVLIARLIYGGKRS
jgi:uncharacterized membrane protein YedE/YeeE